MPIKLTNGRIEPLMGEIDPKDGSRRRAPEDTPRRPDVSGLTVEEARPWLEAYENDIRING